MYTQSIAPGLAEGDALLFTDAFPIHYGLNDPPAGIDDLEDLGVAAVLAVRSAGGPGDVNVAQALRAADAGECQQRLAVQVCVGERDQALVSASVVPFEHPRLDEVLEHIEH